MTKILILDDHALFRDGLQHVLTAMDEDVTVLQSDCLDHAQSAVEQHPDLDLLLIDLDMPVNDGFEALDLFTTLHPTLPCVILSASTKRSDVTKSLENGALGFISKNSRGEALHGALKLILMGETYVPYEIMHAERRTNRSPSIDLTTRQLQVMSLVVEGCPNKIIADRLALAEPTVKMHLSAIFKKLNVHNRSAAIAAVANNQIALPKLEN